MRPEALVILTPGFPADETDTACLPPLHVIVRALANRPSAPKVIVITFQYPFKRATYRWHNAEAHSIGGRDYGKLFRLRTWYRVYRAFKQVHQNYKVTGLLSFWLGECAYVGQQIGNKYRVKHQIYLFGQDAKPGNRFFKRTLPRADQLIALSDFCADTFERNYAIRPQHTIPVGIETALFKKTGTVRHIDILGAGSLIPLKQYDVFINAIARVAKVYPKVKTMICGKGPEMARLQQQIIKLSLQDNVILAGELPHQEVIDLMQRSKIFLHTSNYEGYGAVMAEALYAGCHVVSFCQPMHKIAQHHYIVNDLGAMTQRLITLLSQDLDHQPVLTVTAQDIAEQLLAVYQPLLRELAG